MKIIIIDHEPYTLEKRARYFIDFLLEKGNDVEYWTVQKLFKYSKVANYESFANDSFVQVFNIVDDLIFCLNRLNPLDTFIFLECRQNVDTFFLLNTLFKKKLIWGRLEYFHNPTIGFLNPTSPNKKKTNVERIADKIVSCFDLNWLRYFLIRKFNNSKLIELNTSYISFITGNNTNGLLPAQKYVSIDYFDIVNFEFERKLKPVLNYDYIVFGDVYLGRHPDLQIMYGNDYLDLDRYYRKMNSFFEKIEKFLKIPIVIAAHPKSNYTSEFGNRLVLKGCSTNLIINSKLFMHHGSLSVCNAMLSHKKIVQIKNNDFVNNEALMGFDSIMDRLKDLLLSPIINIDEDLDLDEFVNTEIPISIYENLLDKYFRGEDLNDLANEQVVYRQILELLNDKNTKKN